MSLIHLAAIDPLSQPFPCRVHGPYNRLPATGCQVKNEDSLGGPPQHAVVENGMQSIKARTLLARNIHAILTARGEDQTALAAWCRHKSSWINKILAGKRPMHIDDFDRVADFLGISVYQLFLPGISALTERRRPGDRRSNRERRIGHVERIIVRADSAATGARDETTGSAAEFASAIQALVADFTARANSLLAAPDPRRQNSRTRATQSEPHSRTKRRRGPDAPER